MSSFVEDKMSKMSKRAWRKMVVLLVFSAVMLLNSTFTKSPLIGIPASLAFLCVSSAIAGEVFFADEKRFLKGMLGLATFIALMALSGVLLILAGIFTQTLSLVVIVAISGLFFFLSLREKPVPDSDSFVQPGKGEKVGVGAYLLVFSYLALVAIAFYALILGRTTEGAESVWLTIPSFFLPVFLLSSLFLTFILFFTRISNGPKLGFIIIHSFLAHSLFLIVWYPGRYGDPWSHLGEANFIERAGEPYAYQRLLANLYIVDIVKFRAQHAIVALFKRMVCLDIYWPHVFAVPLLWSIFAPLCSFKIAELLSPRKTKRLPLLAAIVTGLFPHLIVWGAVSVPNSVGFIFFFFSVLLFLYWATNGIKRVWFLSLLTSITAFFAHPQVGIFALSFFLGITLRKSSYRILRGFSYPLVFMAYPLSMYVLKPMFSSEALLRLENLASFESDIFGILRFPLLLLFGFLGLVFGVRSKRVNRKIVLELFLFYAAIVTGYYITQYGSMYVPYGPTRILAMSDFLLVPFAALGLLVTVKELEKSFSRVKVNVSMNLSRTKTVIRLTPRLISIFIICLFLSLLAVQSLYLAYPRDEPVKLQPAAYEIEAIQYIDSTTSGRYVVLCDTQLASLAVGFLGIDYGYGGARGFFGIPEFYYPTIKLYLDMCKSPSISIMEKALSLGKAEVSYFVLSVKSPYDFSTVLEKTSEILPVDKVFGDGKLFVFKYPLSIFEGIGPTVKVVFDDGISTERVSTRYRYMFKSEVTYNLTVSGHSSYNVTDYPEHWMFSDLAVNGVPARFNETSDISTFIYINGVNPDDTIKVVWRANDKYPVVEWKEDSFKTGWRTHPQYPGTIKPYIFSDGNVMSLSWNFTRGSYQVYYYAKPCNISTHDDQYFIVRWRSTGPVAVVTVYFEDGGQSIVPLGAQSFEWTTTIMRLSPGNVIKDVMVGITNVKNMNISGYYKVFVDYILICSEAVS